MPELDSIRGIAILGVVLYHAFYWSRDFSVYTKLQRLFIYSMAPGQFGVNLFFVLSGFLISGILLDSRGRADYYSRFYLRRALRILPAYYFTIILLIVFGLTSSGFLIMSLAYCANLSGLFGIALSYGVLWSLAVEEHFYLLWPAAIRKLDASRLVWLIVVILVFCPVSRLLYHVHSLRTGVPSSFGFYTWNNADGLALGALIAVLLRRPNWGRAELSVLCIVFISLAVLIAGLGYPAIFTRRTAIGEALQTVPWNLACGSLVGLFMLLRTSSWKKIVTPAPLIFFGKISYGLYLYHVMFLGSYAWLLHRLHLGEWIGPKPWIQLWSRAIFALTAAILFSWVSRRYFEELFLRLKDMLPTLVSNATRTHIDENPS